MQQFSRLAVILCTASILSVGCGKKKDDDRGGTPAPTCDASAPDCALAACANVFPCSCGNNIIDNSDEVCDGTALGGRTCLQEGYYGGTLRCASDCSSFDTSQCVGTCGDGTINGSEECDGAALNGLSCTNFGFEGGTLGCASNCRYDTAGCTGEQNFCGNGVIDSVLEACDGRTYIQCRRFPVYTQTGTTFVNLGRGEVGCNDDCTFDLSTCTGADDVPTDYCAVRGLYNNGVCDPCHLLGGTIDPDCENLCTLNDGVCRERFDLLIMDYACRAANFPDPDCGTCGNGIVEGELCDGPSNPYSCEQLGFTGGTLGCTDTCLLDTSTCHHDRICGNNQIDGIPNSDIGEWCDGSAMGGRTCASLGYASGTLSCTDSCTLNTSSCVESVCGDGVTNGWELCDVGTVGEVDPDLRGWTCNFEGYAGGPIGCALDCFEFDVSQCSETSSCGNGIAEAWEACDPGNEHNDPDLLGLDCPDFGRTGAGVTCLENCKGFDLSECSPAPGPATCNNEALDPGEACDGDLLNDKTCADFGFLGTTEGDNGGTLNCKADCSGFDLSECEGPTKPICGNGIAEGAELCDGDSFRNANDRFCANFTIPWTGGLTFGAGATRCNDDCTIDFSTCEAGPVICEVFGWYSDGICDPCEAWGGAPDTADCACGADGVCRAYDAPGGLNSCFASSGDYDPDCYAACGNGVVNPSVNENLGVFAAEQCDPAAELATTCETFGYSSGEDGLGCTAQCRFDFADCVVNDCVPGDPAASRPHQCTFADLRGLDCGAFGLSNQGTSQLTCTDSCQFDLTTCEPTICGDGVAEGWEQCDYDNGTLDLRGRSCAAYTYASGGSQFLFAGGTLGCADNCLVDTSECTEVYECGNGILELFEECEEGVDMGLTCASFGFSGGVLGCEACMFDFTGCDTHECDGEYVDGTDCTDFGYASGLLKCSEDDWRGYDFSECVGPITGQTCGDGHVLGYESCEPGEWYLCHALRLGEGVILCNENCELDLTNCAMPDYCEISGLEQNGVCDAACQIFTGRPDPDCEALCPLADGVCVSRPSFWGDSCALAGFSDPDCPLDEEKCGDGILDDNEVCDPGAPEGEGPVFRGNLTCMDAGYMGEGTLGCTQECTLDFAACEHNPGWTCPEEWYGDGYCDCGCGLMDPSCQGGGCAEEGCEAAACDTIPGWTCNPLYWGDGDCDCGCGVPDPDCGGAGCTEPGCGASACEYCFDETGEIACPE